MNDANNLRHLKARGYTGLVELEHQISGPGHAGEEAALALLRGNDATI
jgi:hypothetical protein